MIDVTGTTVTVDILHRLALGVEPLDALGGRPIDVPLLVERELPQPRTTWVRALRDPLEPWPPGIPLEGTLSGRYRLRHGPSVGKEVTVRIWDRELRFTPRRLHVPLWTLAELLAEEKSGTGDVPVLSRTLRPWLRPGVAAALPRGTTGVRGRITRADNPVPWARVVGRDTADGTVVGRAAANERGEFVLAVTGRAAGPGSAPTMQMGVILEISADPVAVPVADASHRFDALPAESVPRSPKTVLEKDLDTPLMRGETDPTGFMTGTTSPALHLPVGRMLNAADPYEFTV